MKMNNTTNTWTLRDVEDTHARTVLDSAKAILYGTDAGKCESWTVRSGDGTDDEDDGLWIVCRHSKYTREDTREDPGRY